MDGWIKLHRRILDWGWYDDSNTFRLFIHLLLKANHEDRVYRGVTVKRGSLVTGRLQLAEELRLSPQQIRTALLKLKSTSEITSQPTNRFTVISIVNYDLYQQNNQPATTQATNKQPTDNHKQERKNIKKKRNIPSSYSSLKALTPEVLGEIAARYRVSVSAVKQLREELELYCSSKGKTYKDYRAALMNWTMRRIEEGKLQPLSVTRGGSIMEALRKAGRNDL